MARGKSRGKDRFGPSRRTGQEDDSGESRWLTTYGDAVTLLLAFFVMLYSMSSVDAEKFAQLATSLSVAITGEPTGGEGLLDASTAVVGDDSIPEPPSDASSNLADALPPSPAEEVRSELAAELEQALRDAEVETLAHIDTPGDDVVIRIGTDNVLFDTGSAKLDRRGLRVLSALGPIVAAAPNLVRVAGHTDNKPLHDSSYTNWHLSTDRAVAVLDVFQRRHGVEPTRLSAVGYGEHQPLESNGTASGRATNRRVEIVLVGTTLEDTP